MKAALEALLWADRGTAALMGLALIVGALVIWKRSGPAAIACALAGGAICGFEALFIALAQMKIRFGPYDAWVNSFLGVAVSAATWIPLAVMMIILARKKS